MDLLPLNAFSMTGIALSPDFISERLALCLTESRSSFISSADLLSFKLFQSISSPRGSLGFGPSIREIR